jgi:hypothetical protein
MLNQFKWSEAVSRALPFSFGKIFLVVNSSDAWAVDSVGQFGPDADGKVRIFTSLADAYDATVSNRNDVIVLDSNSTFNLSSMLTVSKNRVHFVSAEWLLGIRRHYGQRTKVQLGVTAAATDIGTMKNTGIGNSFRGIKFIGANTVTEGIYTGVEGGEYAYYENCEFYKSTDLDQTGAAELVLNGDSAKFKDCTIGSLADAIGGSSILRPCVTLTAGLAGSGKVCRDSMFENCLFWRQCKDTSNTFVYSANAADVERQLLFKGCGFINNKAATNLPAQAIKGAASLTVGQIILDPNCYAANVTKISTTTGVIVTGSAVSSGAGIGANAA